MIDQVWQSLLALSALFFVVDPIGVLPIFVSMTTGAPPLKRRQMAKKACLIAGTLLLVFAVTGGALFRLLGVTLAAFKVGGGIALLLSGVDMLRGHPTRLKTSDEEQAEAVAKEDV